MIKKIIFTGYVLLVSLLVGWDRPIEALRYGWYIAGCYGKT
jgi:hypothetical protein